MTDSDENSSNQDENDRSPSPEVDVCVVGSGPAGALAAYRLASKGYEVVVLEAGERFDRSERLDRMERSIRPAHGFTDVWDMGGDRDEYSSSGEDFYPLNHSRVKGVGGTSLHWQGMVMRLHEKDFESETRYGVGDDWPISYDDLQPYYAEAEEEMGVAGAQDNPFSPPRENDFPMPAFPQSYSDSLFEEACDDLGIEIHSVPNARNSEPYDGRSRCQGYGTCKPVCPSGAKYSADVHVRKAEEEGARVIDQAPVQHLEHTENRVEAAVYATPDGETHRQEARSFILACGGVETPRLLLLSKSEHYPDGLANSSGLVGRYFMDHLFAGAGGSLDRETRQNHVGFLTSESHQFYESELPEYGSIKLEFFNYAGPSPVISALNAQEWGDNLLEDLRAQYGNRIAMGGLVEQLPRKENRVKLDSSTTDNHGNPVPDIQWSVGEFEKRTIERANEVQREILEELGVDVDWISGPEDTGPAYHHMGTTRMGTDPDESVVNPRTRTHDMDNLYIASSSVFVTAGAMNPTLTIGALALRAADHVSRDL